jgi:hypothetical protein
MRLTAISIAFSLDRRLTVSIGFILSLKIDGFGDFSEWSWLLALLAVPDSEVRNKFN